MLRGYGRRRKSTSTGGRRRRHTGGRYLYSGGGPLYSGGAVNPWREFVKANKGRFHLFKELAEQYHAMKRAGEIIVRIFLTIINRMITNTSLFMKNYS
jgi:hypothetical protein